MDSDSEWGTSLGAGHLGNRESASQRIFLTITAWVVICNRFSHANDSNRVFFFSTESRICFGNTASVEVR